MPTTIISNISSFDYEPDIITDNTRDGISTFQFSIIGSFEELNSNFLLDQVVYGVPDQPTGRFRVVRRNLSHIAGDASVGLYRLQVSAEGGTGDSSLYILETSYQYQKEIVSGFVQLPALDAPFNYTCEWLSPTVTITTNSSSEDVTQAQAKAEEILTLLEVQIIRNKPDTVAFIGTVQYPVFGARIDENTTRIIGSSIENAGGLFRVRASATKGQIV
jgi:hypothetical protein